MTIVPDDLGDMATWVISQCVFNAGTGGYVTKGIANLINFLGDNPSILDRTYRKGNCLLSFLEHQTNMRPI